jgi:pilus assembly protein Flp/PilA
MEFISRLRSFVRDEEGQDLLEYALLIALIALVCVGAVALAGTKVSQVFTNIAGQIPAGTEFHVGYFRSVCSRPAVPSGSPGRPSAQLTGLREGEEPMQAMVSVIYRLVVRNDAQDLTEYGLLAALIAIAALAAVTTLGDTIRTVLWAPIASNF